jgi:murein DD-endopeptidase MepM/ murein hydrolase activator NlpD
MALRVFPVDASGRPAFADAFGSHRGTDIFAPAGTPVLAVDAGDVRADIDPKGGNVAYLKAADGAVYYYAHLADYNGAFPRAVVAGEALGTVGTTGNALGKDPHLHFEVHPNGDHDTIDPFPLLMDVAPSGALKLPVPVMPLPPNPLAGEKKKRVAAQSPGLWFWAWGRLLSLRISGRAERGAGLFTGEL